MIGSLKFYISTILISVCVSLKAQTWNIVFPENIPSVGVKDIEPSVYRLYQMDDSIMKQLLWNAPNEEISVHLSETIIAVAMPDLVVERFKVVRYNMMEDMLAISFADIRTFYGVGVNDSLTSIRIDYTVHGFRAVIQHPNKEKVFIDHYQRSDLNTRVVYYKNDYKKMPSWGCNITDEHLNQTRPTTKGGNRIGDCSLRSYRLAQATTGEYSAYHGNTPTSVMSAITTAINRVNQVYESEVAVRLILIDNTNLLFYYNPNTDPYTNNNGGAMLGQNITNCNNVIGSANYDIGHVFSTGGGGVAYLASVCGSNKAGGVTGSPAPVGDPFTIDYVAHEIGHQFGGNHTFAGNSGSCSGGNRNNPTAMEPGSGSTIMAYAGICSPNDVQNNSDDYFHAINIEEIKVFIGSGSSCETFVSSFVNTSPSVTAQSNYSIPISTPFLLNLLATDAENDPITYAWEQMDNITANVTTPPATTNTTGPMFRSRKQTTNPQRYFPPLANLIANSINTWERLPSIARSLNFRGVARDFTGVAGCNNEINITVSTVNAGNGAFSITSQNTASTWTEGANATITWNIAGTASAPINSPNVDILLSYDGGNTYPVTVLSATPNDGTQIITVPSGTSTQARVMIRGTNHIFYDINNTNITINPEPASFTITASPIRFDVCPDTPISVNITTSIIGNFSTLINLTVTGLPTGSTATFANNPITPGTATTMNISNATIAGTYLVTLTGTAGSEVKTAQVEVIIKPLVLITLTSPTNNETNLSLKPTLSWTGNNTPTSYDVQVSYDDTFSNLIINTTSITNSYIVNTSLYGGTTFYWRVRGYNTCNNGSWSSVRSFTVEHCYFYNPQTLPIILPLDTLGITTSTIEITDKGNISDVNLLNLSGGLSTGITNLSFTLLNPSNNTSLFWDSPCEREATFDISFDDQAPNSSWPCPPVNGTAFQPSNPLSTLNNDPLTGTWTLSIDKNTYDEGVVGNWEMKVCATNFCRLTVDHLRPTGPGSLVEAINCAVDGDTIRISSAIVNDTINLLTQNLTISKNIVIQSEVAQNIYIKSSSTSATLINNTPISGLGLRIKGFHIYVSNSPQGAIVNNGKLILEDVTLHKGISSSTATITNAINSLTEIIGLCKIVN